jgi:23S rRNA pseudouridine1911/1915/1917 synthase
VGETREWVVATGGERLDRAVTSVWGDLSRARVQALLAEGRITVDGAPARPADRPRAGSRVALDLPEAAPAEPAPQDLPLRILHDDDDLLVVVKPAGMVVHPAPGHPDGTLVNALLHHAGGLSGIGGVARPGIVHRLDVGTSGVMVVAKHDQAHRALTEQFSVHSVERRYFAIVHRAPHLDRGTLRSQLARDPQDRLRIASVESGGRPAITHWEVRARGDRVALLECRLETGRTHQVRVHLSEAGHPIVADRTYNRRDCVPTAELRAAVDALTHPMLHAWLLAFTHPGTGERVRFEAAPPPDFLALCALAGLPVPPVGDPAQ